MVVLAQSLAQGSECIIVARDNGLHAKRHQVMEQVAPSVQLWALDYQKVTDNL